MQVYTINGFIHRIFDEKKATEKFRVREFVLEADGGTQYPQYVRFQTVQDGCRMLDELSVGDQVLVSFQLGGRQGKPDANGNETFWNSLTATRIDGVYSPKGGA